MPQLRQFFLMKTAVLRRMRTCADSYCEQNQGGCVGTCASFKLQNHGTVLHNYSGLLCRKYLQQRHLYRMCRVIAFCRRLRLRCR